MSVFLRCLSKEITVSKIFVDQLTAMIDRLLTEQGFTGGEVGIILGDDSYLHDLNRKYRGRDVPTDVLSFSYLEEEYNGDNPGEHEFAVGDIYISIDRACEQAEQAGHSLEREVALLAVHGFLHLLGYDHEQADDARLMRKKELELLEEMEPGTSRGEKGE